MPDDQLQSRKRHRGVIGIESKVPIRDRSVLSLIYTPGVAEPCLAIHKDPVTSFEYTCRGNTIAVVTDGSKVLSLGSRGPHAALPIMEGNAVVFKTFAGEGLEEHGDRKSTRLNSSHSQISYAVFCLKKKKKITKKIHKTQKK